MRILVLCTGNSAPSRMAEAILRALDPRPEVCSVGTEPAGPVNPFAVEAMRRIGIDISAARPKHVREFLGKLFDYVITVCGEAGRNCPVFTGEVRRRDRIRGGSRCSGACETPFASSSASCTKRRSGAPYERRGTESRRAAKVW